jgi:hypothetical protein
MSDRHAERELARKIASDLGRETLHGNVPIETTMLLAEEVLRSAGDIERFRQGVLDYLLKMRRDWMSPVTRSADGIGAIRAIDEAIADIGRMRPDGSIPED